MFDLRYHVVSIVAVFLALTIGLLLGSLVAEQGGLAKRQERLVASIRADVNKLLERNNSLQQEVSDLRAFQDQVLGPAVRGRLQGRKVAVVSLVAGQEGLYRSISSALTGAGAEPIHLYFNLDKLDFTSDGLRSKIESVSTTETSGSAGFEQAFWAQSAREIGGREPPQLTLKLGAEGLLSASGTFSPVDAVVLLAADRKKVANRDVLVLEALRGVPDLMVVGAEALAQKPSRVSAYQLKNVSTVDNVDTVTGRIALVYSLQDQAVVNYGLKSTADKLLP